MGAPSVSRTGGGRRRSARAALGLISTRYRLEEVTPRVLRVDLVFGLLDQSLQQSQVPQRDHSGDVLLLAAEDEPLPASQVARQLGGGREPAHRPASSRHY